MLFAQEFSGSQLILFGVSILAGTLLLRRAAVRLQRSKARDVQAEVRDEMRAAEEAGSATIRNLELRMYEFSREVEGRMQTRIATLDQLVVDADREIDRLRRLIAQSRQAEPSIRMKPGPEIIGPAVDRGGEDPPNHADAA